MSAAVQCAMRRLRRLRRHCSQVMNVVVVDRSLKEAWIKAKYVDKSFLGQLNCTSPGLALFTAIQGGTAVERFCALAQCAKADINYRDPVNGRSVLHEACARGDSMWAQMLIWVGVLLLPITIPTPFSTIFLLPIPTPTLFPPSSLNYILFHLCCWLGLSQHVQHASV